MSVQEYHCQEHGTFEKTFKFDDQITSRIKCPGQEDGHYANWIPSIPRIVVKNGTGAGARKFRG